MDKANRPMVAGHYQQDDGNDASLKRPLIATSALTAAALALMMAVTPQAFAVPLTYDFTANASVVLGGNTEAVSGSFDYDSVTGDESNVTIILTGLSSFATLTYSQAASLSTSPNIVSGEGGYLDADILELQFASNFPADPSSYDPIDLSGTYWYRAAPPYGDYAATAVSGGVGNLPVPEPTSLALFGAALVLLSLRRRSWRS